MAGSFWDNPFGGIFDLNNDGKEDFFETAFGVSLFSNLISELEKEDDDWRYHRFDGLEYGIDTDDYETEYDYDMAILEAQKDEE